MKTICIVLATAYAVSGTLAERPLVQPDGSAEATATSPPFYPSPLGYGANEWAQAYEKARKFVAGLSITEKVNLTTGTGWESMECVGSTGSIPRLQFPSLCLQDSPLGVRDTDFVSAWPAGLTAASTWNKQLMYDRGAGMGREFKAKGANVQLGPVAGPLGRTPYGGRNWEGFSPDPYLTGWGMTQTIRGIQDSGVIACAKHLIGNEQERFRQVSESIGFGFNITESLSSNIDDRTMHELYLWPFADAIRAGVGSIMCSYNMINNSYACQNSKLLNGLAKDELDFQGFVMSDWGATKSGVAAVMAGLDMIMPGDGASFNDGASYFGPNLTLAVVNGSVPIQRLDDMATRIMAAYFLVGQDNFPEPNFSSWTQDTETFKYFYAQVGYGPINQHVYARATGSSQLNRNIAAEAVILLKNSNSALPLNITKIRSIALVGSDAGPGLYGANGCTDRGCLNGTLAMGWGSGTANFPYLVTPAEAIQTRAISEGQIVEAVIDDYAYTQINKTVRPADVSIVFIASDSGEGYIEFDGNIGDRNNLSVWNDGDKLVQTVASNCDNTIVVVHSVGAIDYSKWEAQPNVTAILLAHLPGEQSGNAIVDVLYGDVNPSGKLPYTIAKNVSDYRNELLTVPNNLIPQQNFVEGLQVDYRAFDMLNIEPLYEFGFGLSYSNFSYSELKVNKLSDAPYAARQPQPTPTAAPSITKTDIQDIIFPSSISSLSSFIYPYLKATPVKTSLYSESNVLPTSPAGGAPGGNPSLYDILASVTVSIQNTGTISGQEVVQLYIGIPYENTPPKQLRGFEKVNLAPNQSQSVIFDLLRRDLSIWNVTTQNWWMPPGQIKVFVGSSSRSLPLSGILSF